MLYVVKPVNSSYAELQLELRLSNGVTDSLQQLHFQVIFVYGKFTGLRDHHKPCRTSCVICVGVQSSYSCRVFAGDCNQ